MGPMNTSGCRRAYASIGVEGATAFPFTPDSRNVERIARNAPAVRHFEIKDIDRFDRGHESRLRDKRAKVPERSRPGRFQYRAPRAVWQSELPFSVECPREPSPIQQIAPKSPFPDRGLKRQLELRFRVILDRAILPMLVAKNGKHLLGRRRHVSQRKIVFHGKVTLRHGSSRGPVQSYSYSCSYSYSSFFSFTPPLTAPPHPPSSPESAHTPSRSPDQPSASRSPRAHPQTAHSPPPRARSKPP